MTTVRRTYVDVAIIDGRVALIMPIDSIDVVDVSQTDEPDMRVMLTLGKPEDAEKLGRSLFHMAEVVVRRPS